MSERVRPVTSTRRDIQGLRAIAVLLVIADHLLGAPQGGFVGVDVFFVISGFLITGILLREYNRSGTISFVGFYNRRIRRIVPAATLVIIATITVAYLLLPRGRFVQTALDGLWAFLFVGNWNMGLRGTDYFQIGLPPSPLQHYWSLSVEEQFYLVWPWLTLAFLIIAAKRGWAMSARQNLVRVVFVVLTIVSFAWAMFESTTNPELAYFSTVSRAWELGIGAVLAAFVPAFRALPSTARGVMAWLGLAGIAASALAVSPATGFPAPWAALPVLSTALVLAAGIAAPATHDLVLAPITNRIVGYIGDISYSLYLWHFPVVVLLLAVLPDGSPVYVATALALTFVLAALSYRFVEQVFRSTNEHPRRKRRGRSRGSGQRRSGRIGLSPNRRIQLLGLGVLAFAGAVVFVVAQGNLAHLSGPGASQVASAEEQNCLGAASIAPDSRCDGTELGENLWPSIDALSSDTGGAYDCYRGEDEKMETCAYGDRGASVRVALIGDSHAAMLLPALVPALGDAGWSLDTFIGNGCQWKQPLGGKCSPYMADLEQQLVSDPYDVIITSATRWVGGDREVASRAFRAAWEPVMAVGTQVIVIADAPSVTEDALACIARVGFTPSTSDCSTPRETAGDPIDPLVAATVGSSAHLIDLTEYYCTAQSCPAVIGNAQVYRDAAAHVTATYMRSLSPYLMQKVAAAIGGQTAAP